MPGEVLRGVAAVLCDIDDTLTLHGRLPAVAFDCCEDVAPLPLATAEAIRQALEAHGAQAKVSSIHVNAWFGKHDKLTMTRRFLAEVLGVDADRERRRIAFVGDSPNDMPMF